MTMRALRYCDNYYAGKCTSQANWHHYIAKPHARMGKAGCVKLYFNYITPGAEVSYGCRQLLPLQLQYAELMIVRVVRRRRALTVAKNVAVFGYDNIKP